MTTHDRLTDLQARGFDESYALGRSRPTAICVQCPRCEAAVINGIAAHETGCPQARHECHGCNNLIPANQKYCGECNQ